MEKLVAIVFIPLTQTPLTFCLWWGLMQGVGNGTDFL